MQKVIDTLKSPQFWQVLVMLFGFVGLAGPTIDWLTVNQLLLVDLFAVVSLIIASIRTQKVVSALDAVHNDYTQKMELALYQRGVSVDEVEAIMEKVH